MTIQEIDGDMMEDKINQDLKQAMLAKETLKVTVLRSIKSAFTYAKVAPGGAGQDAAMTDDDVMAILAKEAKKRQESADSYIKAGSTERAEAELAEKAIIEAYLPAKLTTEELASVVDEVVSGVGEVSPQAMGQVIGQVKARVGTAADGGDIAQAVKARLQQGAGQ